jgi:hypothetical protein
VIREHNPTNNMRKEGSTILSQKLFRLTIGGGLVFWAASIATSLLPIAVEYRAVYSNWSIQTVWVVSLPAGILFGYCVSYFLLRYFDKIPSKNPILKSVILSFIALIFVVILIDVPQSFFEISNSLTAWYYFLIGLLFNGVRFLLLGIVIGYLYTERSHSQVRRDKK